MSVCVALVVFLVLALLAVPQVPFCGLRGPTFQIVNNEKQIFLAALTMENDGIDAKDSRLSWPGDLAAAPVDPVTTFAGYIEQLIRGDYLRRADVAKLLAMEGVPRYPGTGPVTSAYSPFKIYRVRESDVSNCLFIATKNFTLAHPLDAGQPPFPKPHFWLFGPSERERYFVILRKGGDAIPYYNAQSALRKNLGVMPGHSSPEDPGVETPESILEM